MNKLEFVEVLKEENGLNKFEAAAVVDGALQPIIIDRANNVGRYEDPNLWMLHTI